MNVLKFVGLLAGMALVTAYIPFGFLICIAVNMIALWKLVND